MCAKVGIKHEQSYYGLFPFTLSENKFTNTHKHKSYFLTTNAKQHSCKKCVQCDMHDMNSRSSNHWGKKNKNQQALINLFVRIHTCAHTKFLNRSARGGTYESWLSARMLVFSKEDKHASHVTCFVPCFHLAACLLFTGKSELQFSQNLLTL